MKLDNNVRVKLISGTDEICRFCPNNKNGICDSEDKVTAYDRAVLMLCGLEHETEMEFHIFRTKVNENILKAGLRRKICGDCQWDGICGN